MSGNSFAPDNTRDLLDRFGAKNLGNLSQVAMPEACFGCKHLEVWELGNRDLHALCLAGRRQIVVERRDESQGVLRVRMSIVPESGDCKELR